MSHEAYAPVGYSYQAAHYCLDCIPVVASRCNEHKGQNCSHSGYKPKACTAQPIRDRLARTRSTAVLRAPSAMR